MESRVAEVGDKVASDITNRTKAAIEDLKRDINSLPANELKINCQIMKEHLLN